VIPNHGNLRWFVTRRVGLREARYECPSNLDQVFVYAWDRRLNKLEAGNTYS